MTETLARIYVEQKNYERAIQSYTILSLKYPEKSGLFADQIKAIKQLQEKNKKTHEYVFNIFGINSHRRIFIGRSDYGTKSKGGGLSSSFGGGGGQQLGGVKKTTDFLDKSTWALATLLLALILLSNLAINSGSEGDLESKALDPESTSTPAVEAPAENIPLTTDESSEESE